MTPREVQSAHSARLRILARTAGYPGPAQLGRASGLGDVIRRPWQGKQMLRPVHAVRVAELLGCTPGFLLFGDEKSGAIATEAQMLARVAQVAK